MLESGSYATVRDIAKAEAIIPGCWRSDKRAPPFGRFRSDDQASTDN
jgi:hypothetical protein